MPRQSPNGVIARLARPAIAVALLASVWLPGSAVAAVPERKGPDLTRWLSTAAAKALQAAGPTNDPAVVGIEGFNHAAAGAFQQLQAFGPTWAQRVDLNVSLDREVRPRYGIAATQPIVTFAAHEIALHAQLRHEPSTTGGDLGVRWRGRLYQQQVAFGIDGGLQDRREQRVQRHRVGAEFRLSQLEFRANLFDDIPEYPVAPAIAGRRLDGYDVSIGAQVPGLPWAWLRANRFWQIAADSDEATAGDRLSLRLLPLAPLEIEAGTLGGEEDRSWFAQLRVRFRLGDPG